MAPQRVLIVEDEWLIARDYISMLGRAGHVVVGPAATTEAALALIEAEQPDVALVDFQLCSETSEQVVDRLREAGIPVVVISGHTPSEMPEAFAVESVIAKPADPRLLLNVIEQLTAPAAGRS